MDEEVKAKLDMTDADSIIIFLIKEAEKPFYIRNLQVEATLSLVLALDRLDETLVHGGYAK
jgi:hypothetical protein